MSQLRGFNVPEKEPDVIVALAKLAGTFFAWAGGCLLSYGFSRYVFTALGW